VTNNVLQSNYILILVAFLLLIGVIAGEKSVIVYFLFLLQYHVKTKSYDTIPFLKAKLLSSFCVSKCWVG